MADRIVIAALILFGGACSVIAETADRQPDGNTLLNDCTAAVRLADGDEVTPPENLDAIYCLGMIQGISLADEIHGAAGHQRFFCPPQEAQTRQLVRVVVKWLNEHPKRLHEIDGVLIVLALSRGFPCDE